MLRKLLLILILLFIFCSSTFAADKKYSKFDRHFDLKDFNDEITSDDIDYLINTILGNRKSELRDCGEAFIAASNATGLNPIFLLCLTAQEAGWVVSPLHAKKCNAYSINMNDCKVSRGYTMGDSFKEGIITGAIWIDTNYYSKGQISLHLFIYGGKCYSSSKDKWISDITYNINKCYKLLNKKES